MQLGKEEKPKNPTDHREKQWESMELPEEGVLPWYSQPGHSYFLLTVGRFRVVAWFGVRKPSDAHKFVQMMKLRRLRRERKEKA